MVEWLGQLPYSKKVSGSFFYDNSESLSVEFQRKQRKRSKYTAGKCCEIYIYKYCNEGVHILAEICPVRYSVYILRQSKGLLVGDGEA